MGYGSRALKLLREYYEGKFSTGTTQNIQDSMLFNMFKEDESNEDQNDENDVRPAKELPPLLCRLNERKPESLDYLGVSYGVNTNLLKFWKKNGFITCYLRATTNELTGDHTCIMLKNLKTHALNGKPNSCYLKYFCILAEYEKKDGWIYVYFSEFRRRFLRQLSSEFKEFLPHLALSLLQLAAKDLDNKLPERKGKQFFLKLIKKQILF